MADISEILGNNEIKEHFLTAVNYGKISHAYLLEGEKGSGKKMIASSFSKILQCETSKRFPFSGKISQWEEKDANSGNMSRELPLSATISACGKCESCIQTEHKTHPDIIWVTHEKPAIIKVGEIRDQVIHTIDIKPYKGPYKIYIIDDAEKMNAEAQNALLKSIEEPPEYAVFFLLTNNRGALLDTILSRCILLPVKPVSKDQIIDYLIKREEITKEEAEFAAAFSMGNIGKAILAATSEEFQEIKQVTVALLKMIHEAEIYEIEESVKKLKGWKDRIDDFFDIFLIWFRDLLFFKIDSKKSKDKIIFKGESLSLKKQADMISLESIDYIIRRIDCAKTRIRANVNFDVSIELLFLETRREFQHKIKGENNG